jgi:hypothetical protein
VSHRGIKVHLTPIRIAIDAVPRMLREIIERTVAGQSDMQLVDVQGAPDLSTAITRSAAQVVIVTDAGNRSCASPQRLLIDHPDLKVLVVTDDGRAAHMVEFRRTPIVRVSPQGLLEAIRAVMA